MDSIAQDWRIGVPSASENTMEIVEKLYAMSCLSLNHSHSITFQIMQAVPPLPITGKNYLAFSLSPDDGTGNVHGIQ